MKPIRTLKSESSQAIRYIRGCMAILVSVLFLVEPVTLAAAETPQVIKQYYDAQSVTLGGNGSEVVFGEGDHILITSANSVRLLPGIKLEAGCQVKVEVSVTAIPEVQEPGHSIMLRPELLVTKIFSAESSLQSSPDSEDAFHSFTGPYAVIPVQTSNGNQLQIIRKTSTSLTEGLHYSYTLTNGYSPLLTWGCRPENIKVLRT